MDSQQQQQQQEEERGDVMEKVAELRGKVTKYHVLRQLHGEQKEACSRRAIELRQMEEKLKEVTSEYQQVCVQLHDFTSQQPAVAEQCADLLRDVQPFSDVPLQASQAHMSAECNQTLTDMILNAAATAKDMQHKLELLQSMLKDKTKEVEELKRRLEYNEINVKQSERSVATLNDEIAKLKVELSKHDHHQQQQQHDMDWTMFDTEGRETAEDLSVELASVDPATLKERIRELRQRISELMAHNTKWKEICENLQQQLELANSKLRQFEKTLSDIKVERDDALEEAKRERELKQRSEELCRQLSSEVNRLEMRVHDLEVQLESTELQQSQTPGELADQVIALEMQVEEYKEGLETEKKEHAITKAQKTSVDQQWKSLFDELTTKKRQLEQVTKDNKALLEESKRLRQQLTDACCDRSHIEQYLTAAQSVPGPVASSAETRYHSLYHSESSYKHLQQQPITTAAPIGMSSDPPRRGRLEEDDVFIPPSAPQRAGVRFGNIALKSMSQCPQDVMKWICSECTFYNTNARHVTSCEVCSSLRHGLVMQATSDDGCQRDPDLSNLSTNRVIATYRHGKKHSESPQKNRSAGTEERGHFELKPGDGAMTSKRQLSAASKLQQVMSSQKRSLLNVL